MRASNANKMLLIIPCVALAGWLLGGSLPVQAKHARKTGAAVSTDCKKDSDCVVVADECCSCSEGGKQHAVHKNEREAYEKDRKKRCAGTVCTAMMSEDSSCAKRPFCGAGICELEDPPAKAPEEPAKPHEEDPAAKPH